MKSTFSTHISLAAALSLISGLSSLSMASSLDWKQNSVLASGKWIRIETGVEGITRIPYETLSRMGFTHPEKVGVYGRGGETLPTSFTDAEGNPLVEDDISPVGCLHQGDALFFYARSTDPYEFTSTHGGYFTHKGKNIYSDKTVYFLSDSKDPVLVSESSAAEGGPADGLRCIAYSFHEKDLSQNLFNDGQVFWGEPVSDKANPYKEKVHIQGAIPGNVGIMDCGFYIESSDKNSPMGTLEFGVSDSANRFSLKVPYNSTSYFRPVPETVFTDLRIPSEDFEVFASYDSTDENLLCANLDYWCISCDIDPRRAISDSDPQSTFAVQAYAQGQYVVNAPDGDGVMAWDVTDPRHPELLRPSAAGAGHIVEFDEGLVKMVSLFNASGRLHEVGSWAEVPNQDIHSEACSGADFAIITLPEFEPQARRLASLHERHYGQKCIVATSRQLYNEFSAGTPDIMAYRRFVRMLYDSPTPVTNVLLFGAVRSEARGIQCLDPLPEHLIAYQTPYSTKRDGAMNDNDFIGIMQDYIASDARLENAEIQVGVGLLPVISSLEADIYVDKVERYLCDTNIAEAMGSHLIIGCDGDSHQHESQSLKLEEALAAYNDGQLTTCLFNGHHGNERTHSLIMGTLEKGVGMASYIGHGGNFLLTKTSGVFEYRDISRLRNCHTPFMFFSACDITHPDKGVRGLSENMVLGSRYGLIGTITSTRTAWSGPNFELMKGFYSALYQGNEDKTDLLPITLGEAYAKSKSALSSSNELSFILLADPALKIPLAFRQMSDPCVTVKTGEKTSLSGIVTDLDGNIDESFNGPVKVALMMPREEEYIEGTITDTSAGLWVKSIPEPVTVGVGEAKDGRYSATILIPAAIKSDMPDDLSMHLTAYDPDRHVSASSLHSCAVDREPASASSDRKAPWITDFNYDFRSAMLVFDIADDTALDFSESFPQPGFTMRIDGVDVPQYRCHDITMSQDMTSCRRRIPADNLCDGPHYALVSVRDAAGNVHSEEFHFETGMSAATSLEAECLNVQHKVAFKVIGVNTDGDILIYDMTGKRMATVPVDDGVADFSSDILPAGRYRAVFASKDGEIRSNTVTITLI